MPSKPGADLMMHYLKDWARENPAIPPVIVLLLAVVTINIMQTGPMELRVPVQFGQLVLLSWDEQPGAVAYQIEGRYLDGEWETAMTVWCSTTAQLPLPIGMTQFRIRTWTMDGPRAWSAPTRWIKFLPPHPPLGAEIVLEQA